jgi:hypothetical protein
MTFFLALVFLSISISALASVSVHKDQPPKYDSVLSCQFKGIKTKGKTKRLDWRKGDLVDFIQVFFYYWQKNISADLHVSGNSKTFLPL